MSRNTSETNKPMRRGGPMGGMRGAADKPKNFKKSLGKLIRYLKPYRISIFISIFFALLSTALVIAIPKVLEELMKTIQMGLFPGAHIDFARITSFGLIITGMILLSGILGYIQNFIMSGVTVKATIRMRSQIAEKINRLPLKYFDGTSYGDILSRITNDVDNIGQTLNQSITNIISSVATVIGVLVMMLTISWQLTLINLVSLPISLLLMMIIIKLSQKYFTQNQASLGEINGHIEEIYSAHKVVQVYGGEEEALKKFDEVNKKLTGAGRRSQFLSGLVHPAMSFVGSLIFLFICVIGGAMALQNPLFLSSIMAFLLYVRQFNQPIMQIGSISNVLQSTAASSERVFEFLAEKEQENESHKTEVLEKVEGKVEFKNVCFGYNEDKEIIHNFNLQVLPGQRVAIVGHTGAGKTTIVNLLMRFYDVNSGQILVDGKSTQDMKREDVRKLFGMVLQDTWLFAGTIMENLKFGREDATTEEVDEVVKSMHLDHFLKTLPEGYSIKFLSEGQIQLITIARAMIQNAPMMILDEATSSVDTRSEILIQSAMDKLMKGRTSFIIAHRLSTIKNADIILVMSDGRVVEQGKHEELLAQKGAYAKLYNSQFARG